MVAQRVLRTCKGKQVFSGMNYRLATAIARKNCLNQIKLSILFDTCAPISVLPYVIIPLVIITSSVSNQCHYWCSQIPKRKHACSNLKPRSSICLDTGWIVYYHKSVLHLSKVIRKFFLKHNKSFRWHLGDYEKHNFFPFEGLWEEKL